MRHEKRFQLGRALAATAAALLLAGAAPASLTEIDSELVTDQLAEPLLATAPEGDTRIFVVERAGQVLIVDDGNILDPPFLDIEDRISGAGEGGLLGLAFDPEFASNGFFFVYYTDLAGDSVVSRFHAAPGATVADAGETVVLIVGQPAANHNGGTVAFGADGFLYLGLGDGGGSNDPDERAQDPTDLLGKLVRIDVGVPPAPGSTASPDGDYAIPGDNPFVGVAGTRDEIWAFGLRNPYRFSFDRTTGDLWLADVGQGAREEVDFEPADDPGGRNYGWDVEEGSICNPNDPAPAPPCGDPSLTRPVHEYAHSAGNCSITGGFVHRGFVPAVQGHYLFGDFCTGRVWSLDPQTLVATDRTGELGAAGGQGFQLGGFGEDGVGGTYVVLRNGSVHRVIPAPPECGDGIDNDGDGRTDTNDPGCLHDAWPEEDPACNNGLDDDEDGDVDLADAQCQLPWNINEGPTPAWGCGLVGVEGFGVLLLVAAARRRSAPDGRRILLR